MKKNARWVLLTNESCSELQALQDMLCDASCLSKLAAKEVCEEVHAERMLNDGFTIVAVVGLSCKRLKCLARQNEITWPIAG